MLRVFLRQRYIISAIQLIYMHMRTTNTAYIYIKKIYVLYTHILYIYTKIKRASFRMRLRSGATRARHPLYPLSIYTIRRLVVLTMDIGRWVYWAEIERKASTVRQTTTSNNNKNTQQTKEKKEEEKNDNFFGKKWDYDERSSLCCCLLLFASHSSNK